MIETPLYDEQNNIQNYDAEIILKSNGDATLKLQLVSKGFFYENAQVHENLTASQAESYNYKVFPFKDFTIKSFDYKIHDSKPIYLSTYTIEIKNFAKKSGSRLLMPANILNPVSDYLNHNRRGQFAEIPYGLTISEEISITLPDNLYIKNIPETESIESKYGEYSLGYIRAEDKILYQRQIVLKTGLFAEDDYEEFHDYLLSIKRIDRRKILLDTKT